MSQKERILYWEKWGGWEEQSMRIVVNRFNALHGDVQVEMVRVADFYSSPNVKRVSAAIAKNEAPDVIGFEYHLVPKFASKGLFIPLDDYLSNKFQQQYFDAFRKMLQYDGHIYGLPSTADIVTLYYNKGLFEHAGLDPEKPPITIEELDVYPQILDKIDEKGSIMRMGFHPLIPGWWPEIWSWLFGGAWFNSEKSEITPDLEENIRAYEWLQSYSRRYRSEALKTFTSLCQRSSGTPENCFFSNKVAMVFEGDWLVKAFQTFAPQLLWDVAPLPSYDGQPMALLALDTLHIPKNAQHPEEALEFIKFVNIPENLENLAINQGKIVPIKNPSKSFFKKHPNPYILKLIQFLNKAELHYSPLISTWDIYLKEITKAIKSIWSLKTTPKRALSRVKQAMSKYV